VCQGVLLAADQTLSMSAGHSATCQNGVEVSDCHNGTTDQDDDIEPSVPASRVRLVQFEKNTTDPLVSSRSPHVINVCHRRKLHPDPVFYLNKHPVSVVKEMNFLGIIFHIKLNFKSHIHKKQMRKIS